MSRGDRADICRRFGIAIRKRRDELGLSQEALASAAGLNRTYVGDVERGARNPSLRNVEKLAKAMRLSVADFFARYVGG